MAGSPEAAPGNFHMSIEQRGGDAVVRLVGSIHMNVCDRLQADLIRLVDRPTRNLVLDLSQLRFICSLGLGALVAAHLRSRHHHGAVRLAAPNSTIRALLEVTKLIKLFPPYDSIDLALAE